VSGTRGEECIVQKVFHAERCRFLSALLVSCFRSSLTKSGNGVEDLVSGFGPDEGFRMVIVDLQIALDHGFEFARAAEGAAPNLFGGERREPALDQIDPGGAGGSEVDMEAGPLGQPVADQGGLVGPVVIDNEMDLKRLGNIGVDGVEKLPELHRPMATMALADHAALKSSAANRLVVPWRW